ncbi:MAG: hypothetical protein H7Y08_13365, partial [Rhizobiaceae bacterium]|nr:hypothetical protein [Rhizobiaceae bacterium]
ASGGNGLRPIGPTFIVPHTWPDVKNAEFEVLQRLSAAARNIGAVMIATDNNGYPLWSSDDRPLDRFAPIDPGTVDFMISLHFESPRLIDVHSYYALWQPLDFYGMFGYERTSEQVLTHIDALSCSSDLADAHAVNLLDGARSATAGPFPFLFHSPPEPYFAPKISSDSRLFSVGSKWERINSERGRHQDLLERLDAEGLIDIYGPRKFLGVEPWRGFATYRGELPFDGKSVVQAVHKSGICLALSSEPHQRSALMSNRLFEGFAAGAAVIANRNAFIDRYCADLVYMIDDRLTGDDLFFQVKDILDEIRAEPERAIARAAEGQARLRDIFSLERCLTMIASGHGERRERFERTFLSTAGVTVILVYTGDSLAEAKECLADIGRQKGVSVSVVLICDDLFAELHESALRSAAGGGIADFRILTGRHRRTHPSVRDGTPPVGTGMRMAEALAEVRTDFFTMMHSDERWFADHLATMAKAMEAAPASSFCASGALDEHQGYANETIRITRSLDTVRLKASPSAFAEGRYAADGGRFLYRRGVIEGLPLSCLPLLDGQESYLLQLAASLEGDLAQSGFATFVRVAARRAMLPASVVPVADQRRYIADAFARHPKWASLSTLSGAAASPAGNTGAALASGEVPMLRLGDDMRVDAGGAGVKYLVGGFSAPEAGFVWVDGVAGTLAFELVDPHGVDVEDVDLELEMSGREASNTLRAQHCTVAVNGMPIAYVEVPGEPKAYRFRLPRGIAARRLLRVEIACDHAEQVFDPNGTLIDKRRLSLRLTRLSVKAASAPVRPKAEFEVTYLTRSHGNGAGFLSEGFYAPEEDFVWLGSGPGRIDFLIDNVDAPLVLRLWLAGYRSRSDGSSQSVEIFVNRVSMSTLTLTDEAKEHVLSLPQGIVPSSGHMSLLLKPKHSSHAVGRTGTITDPRILSAQMVAFRVEVAETVTLELGREMNLASPESAAMVARGFSHAETGFRWIDGTSGVLAFAPASTDGGRPLSLIVEIAGRKQGSGGAFPTCTVMVNSIMAATLDVDDSERRFVIEVPASARQNGVWTVELLASRAGRVLGERGIVLDERNLSLRVHSILLSDKPTENRVEATLLEGAGPAGREEQPGLLDGALKANQVAPIRRLARLLGKLFGRLKS